MFPSEQIWWWWTVKRRWTSLAGTTGTPGSERQMRPVKGCGDGLMGPSCQWREGRGKPDGGKDKNCLRRVKVQTQLKWTDVLCKEKNNGLCGYNLIKWSMTFFLCDYFLFLNANRRWLFCFILVEFCHSIRAVIGCKVLSPLKEMTWRLHWSMQELYMLFLLHYFFNVSTVALCVGVWG